MFKKFLLLFLLLFSFFLFENNLNSYCSVNGGINSCLQGSNLVEPGNVEIGSGGFKNKILGFVFKIGGFLGLVAIGAIVWGSFMMVISSGEEEKVKKAKDMTKWAIIGFLGVVLASSLIALVVNFMYDLG